MATYSDEYLAGLFDGEGSMGCHIQGNAAFVINVSISLGWPDDSIVREFERRFGGNVLLNYGANKNGLIRHKWQANGTKVTRPFLEWAADHLVLKKDIAEAILTVAYDGQTCGGSGDRRIRKDVVEKRANVIMFTRQRNSGKTDVPRALAKLQERWA